MRRLHPECIRCLAVHQLDKVPEGISDDIKADYMQRILKIIGDAPKEYAAPVVARSIAAVQMELFGEKDDFTEIKKHFNQVMLNREDQVRRKVQEAEDPLKMALQYAMIGNYIDFGARYQVDEKYLTELLDSAGEKEFDQEQYEALQRDLAGAGKLVYLTDNCGEIVMDKVLIALLQKQYPNLSITVIVRGAPVSNDATLEDARQIGLTEMVRVIGNGNDIAGTWMPEVSEEAKAELDSADVILAKGQANYETMRKCGRNIYYLFLCKCRLFAAWFGQQQFTGMLINDKDC